MSIISVRPQVCQLDEVTGNKAAYKSGSSIMSCAPGTIFKKSACVCVAGGPPPATGMIDSVFWPIHHKYVLLRVRCTKVGAVYVEKSRVEFE